MECPIDDVTFTMRCRFARARGRERSSRKRPTYTSGSPLSGVFYLRALPFSLGRAFSRTLARFLRRADTCGQAQRYCTTAGPETESLDSLAPILDETSRFGQLSSGPKGTATPDSEINRKNLYDLRRIVYLVVRWFAVSERDDENIFCTGCTLNFLSLLR